MPTSVRIPTILRTYTDGASEVEASGGTLAELIDDLEANHAGIRARILDDSGKLRRFVNVYVGNEDVRFLDGLATAVPEGAQVSVIPAVAGGARTIATTDRVGREELLDFIRPRHRHVMVTRKQSGGLQMSPVTAGVDQEGRIVVSTYPSRAKVKNLRADATISMMVLSEEWDAPWVQVDGTAEVIDAPDSVEPLVDYFRCISGEHPDWDEYRQAMLEEEKTLVRVTIEDWSPIATGGFPPGSED